MNYPLISEYIESIKLAEDNFEELTNLRAVLGDDGQPVMTSGNFAVVFKMRDEATGKLYALKCFTKEQEGRAEAYHQIAEELKDVDSPYLVSLRYLEKELFVDTEQTDETEFPVLLMDWVEGKTLDKYLRENLDDKYALEMLAYRFSQLAQWLIPQLFAHGDLKPDNILVRENGTLVLVDYDGMYVPAMKGQKARELGSPDFRHPQRTENDFDGHIDDFPLVSILLSLKSISKNFQLFLQYGIEGRLLFAESDYRSIYKSIVFKDISLFENSDEVKLVGLFLYLVSSNTPIIYSKSQLKISPPSVSTKNEIIDAIWEDCVRYSSNYKYICGIYGKRETLPYLPFDILEISDKTQIICDNAFQNGPHSPNSSYIDYDINDTPSVYVERISIPEGVVAIGNSAFSNQDLSDICLPNTLFCIGDFAFAGTNINYIYIPDNVVQIGVGILYRCSKLRKVILDCCIEHLPDNMFDDCSDLEYLKLPDGLKSIGNSAFSGCMSLKSITLPFGVVEIGRSAFWGCLSLEKIILPPTVSEIDSAVFKDCNSLTEIYLPKYLQNINEDVFSGCSKLCTISFSGRIKKICLSAFEGCVSLKEIIIPMGSKEYFSQLMRKMTKTDNKIKLLRELEQLAPLSPDEQHRLEDALSFVEKLIDMLTESPVVELKDPFIFVNVLDNTKSSEYILHLLQVQSTYSKDGKTLLKVPATFANPYRDNEPQEKVATMYEIIEGIQYIDDTAFDDSNRFEHITMSNSVISFGHCLCSCKNLKSIVLSNSITIIDPYSFSDLKQLTNISIPDSVSAIGFEAFGGCESLKSIKLSSCIKVIEHGTFDGCVSLEKISIPDGVEYIDNGAFSGCKSLREITLPNNLKGVGTENIFSGCDKLERIIVPSGKISEFAKILPKHVKRLLVEDEELLPF